MGREFGVPDGMLNVSVPEIILQRSRVSAAVGQLAPACVTQRVWVHQKIKAGGSAQPSEYFYESLLR